MRKIEFLWTILLPIFLTIIYFLYVSYRLTNILKLPADPKEYRKFKNICKIIVAILSVIIISIILRETTKTYINMVGYYLKHIINEGYRVSNNMFWKILLIPIIFIMIIYILVFKKIFDVLSDIIDIFKKNSSNKCINTLALYLLIILGIVLFCLLGLFAFKIVVKYLDLLSLISPP